MNSTSERALELAEKLASREIRLSVFDSFTLSNLMDADRDLESILRHYAEIAPKWQAVLNAEPDAYRYSMIGEGQLIGRCFEEEPEAAPFGAPGIHYDSEYVVEEVPLIIKPAP